MATASDDREIGFGLALGVIGTIGAIVMLATGITGQQLVSGWGYALAMIAAALAVVAIHVYE